MRPFRVMRSGTGGGSGGLTPYTAIVAAANPNLWWRLDETSGTAAASNGSLGSAGGTLTGGSTFASSGVSIAAPSGYSGLGTGVDFAASGVDDIRNTSFGSVWSGTDFSIALWVAGSAGGSQYLASRGSNQAALIYQFVTDTVEFFALGYTGSDPRPGSQISLPASDTTTPHLIVYTYDGTTWAGYKDGANVFSVARTFSLAASLDFYLGSDTSTNRTNSKIWDCQLYPRALTATEVANIYAARNNP